MLTTPSYWLATWFGVGFVPLAPGTAGTLAAIPAFLLVRPFGPVAVLGLFALLLLPAVAAASAVALDRGEHDPQVVVVDEVLGVLIALAAAPPTWPGLIVAVVLFRIADQTKPPPARRLEEIAGGWGIILDDVAAGVWAAAGVLLLRASGLLA